MSYGLIYTVPFATLKGTACVVEIEKEGYMGAPTELTGGETPFTVDIDDEEFLYTPTRFSTAKLSVVGGDYLQNLFATDYRQVRVTLLCDNVVTWCGYIKPEVYTQDYTADRFEFEIECVSAFSVLENIDYKTQGDEIAFVSLWSLLQKCMSEAGGRYTGVYIPHVYAATADEYATSANVLQRMTVSEQNFFDEDGEPMTLLEVLEAVCNFFNWTCTDWAGAVYFVDIDHNGAYRLYDAAMTSATDTTPAAQSVQDISFMGTGHALDILPGYNKVTVKCSNYPIGESTWDFDLGDDVRTLVADTITSGNDRSRREFTTTPEGITMYQYNVSDDGTITEVADLTPYMDSAEKMNTLFGALPFRFCNYQMQHDYVDDEWIPSISDYNFTNTIRIRNRKGLSEPDVWIGWDTKLFSVKLPCVTYANGVICINGEIKFACDDVLSPIGAVGMGVLHNLYKVFSLRIGDKWYNGSAWVDEETTFNLEIESAMGSSSENPDSAEYHAIPNDKRPDDPYDGASGYIIRLSEILSGELELCMYSRHEWWQIPDLDIREVGTYLKGLKIGFVKLNGSVDEDDSDRIYENVINENYINELDEIEFKISSYNNDGACYSKVMLDGNLLTDNLYNCILGKSKRPEEMMITRIINHYSAPQVKLTQPVRFRSDRPITPITRLTDTFQPGKTFINAGGTIDYRMNQFECVMIEI